MPHEFERATKAEQASETGRAALQAAVADGSTDGGTWPVRAKLKAVAFDLSS